MVTCHLGSKKIEKNNNKYIAHYYNNSDDYWEICKDRQLRDFSAKICLPTLSLSKLSNNEVIDLLQQERMLVVDVADESISINEIMPCHSWFPLNEPQTHSTK